MFDLVVTFPSKGIAINYFDALTQSEGINKIQVSTENTLCVSIGDQFINLNFDDSLSISKMLSEFKNSRFLSHDCILGSQSNIVLSKIDLILDKNPKHLEA